MARNNAVDKNSAEYLSSKIGGGRHSLLLIVAFTVVNLLMVVLDSSTYFLFSASVPYYLTLYSKGIDNGFVDGPWPENGPVTIVALIVSGVILLLFLLCWLLSRKRTGWLVPALVLFVLDCLALIGICVWAQDFSGILDIAFHAFVLYYLIMGVKYGNQLKNLPSEEEEQPQQPQQPQTPAGPEF